MIKSSALHDLIGRIKRHNFYGILSIYDPGQTTGFAVFERGPDHTTLLHADQLPTWPLERGAQVLRDSLDKWHPNHMVYEAYHIYSWKSDEHKFSEVPTLQIIGALRAYTIDRGIPETSQTAQIGKGFCTDAKLETWGLYLPGLIHARDAIRHGCHYLLFGSIQPQF